MDANQTIPHKSYRSIPKQQNKRKRRHGTSLIGIIATIFAAVVLLQNVTGGTGLLDFFTNSEYRNFVNAHGWNLVLVNSSHQLPSDYPIDLLTLKGGYEVDRRIYTDLQQMFDDARANGVKPVVVSGYRSSSRQSSLLEKKINEYRAQGRSRADAQAAAAMWVAAPGTSEHQTGLALDIASENNLLLDEDQGDTNVQKWLAANSYKYGFILRYAKGKTKLTGINYEPWHYRYVGREAALEMYEKGLCLEEYLELSH